MTPDQEKVLREHLYVTNGPTCCTCGYESRLSKNPSHYIAHLKSLWPVPNAETGRGSVMPITADQLDNLVWETGGRDSSDEDADCIVDFDKLAAKINQFFGARAAEDGAGK